MLEITEDNKINVPKGIRYISEWKDYSLSDFNFPHILNKRIPGCGFTEYCITSNLNVILCSPRIRLPLYQLLERHIPTIVVISYSELITDIKVEAVDTIGEGGY